jgi:hypothetical protein
MATMRETFLDINQRWRYSDWPSKNAHLWLDFGDAPGGMARLRPAFVIFRITWHPNWKVYVDGQAVQTMMLSPGTVGGRTAAGRHRVVCRYEPGLEKIVLLLGGVLGVILLGAWEHRSQKSR